MFIRYLSILKDLPGFLNRFDLFLDAICFRF